MLELIQPRLTTLLVCLGVALGASACGGSTTMEQSWKSPVQPVGSLRNVVTLYVSRDGTMRRTAEDAMARKLAHMGVRAVPAYSVLTSSDLRDRDRAKAKLLANGFDGVVALRLVSQNTELTVTPTTFDGYWGTAWPGAYDPEYLSTETVVRVETSVYELANSKLLWSGLSKTVDPNSTSAAIDGVTNVVAQSLVKHQIVASSGAPNTSG